jgi:peptidoglycan-associated lipoprotein
MNKVLNKVTGMMGGLKREKRSTAMRSKLVAAGLVLACLGTASPAFSDFGSNVTLKLGASGLYNHRLVARRAIVGLRQAGGHISIDFVIPGRAFALSPFLDVYHRVQTDASGIRLRNDVATNVIMGGNFLFTGFRSERATMYMGLGGGVTRMKVNTSLTDPRTTGYKSKLMADALMGVELKVAPKIALFVEPHYMWATKVLNGLAVHAGLAFRFDKARVAPPVRLDPPVYRSEIPVPIVPEPVKAEIPVPIVPEPVKVVEAVKIKTSSAEALATMQEMIYFQNNKSDLSEKSMATLRDKVMVFQANPAMRIVITGFTSKSGTEAYNMALGLRRAEAAKGYLISQGVDPIRIEITTLGEGQLADEGSGVVAAAANRRGQFRLLIADPFLEAPK